MPTSPPIAPAPTPTSPTRGAPSLRPGRTENTLTVALPLVLGAGVFAVSFAHIHDIARWAGQPDWAAWLIAASVELMAIAAILEIRYRHRHGAGIGWPVLTLIAGIGMSGAANLTATGRTLQGPAGAWTPAMAIWPVVAFGLVAGLKATRPSHGERLSLSSGPEASKDATDTPPGNTGRAGTTTPLPVELAAAARQVADQLICEGRPITRTALARGVRAAGHRIASDRAYLLETAIHATAPHDSSPPGDGP